jgi:acetyl-CoA carboxylase beta subunit
MFDLKPNYVTDSGNKKVAVQLKLKTYEKIEEILENYSLFHLMEDAPGEEPLNHEKAKAYYKKLKKKK